MFKLIRIAFMFCLLIGVVFLGAKIYKRSAQVEPGQDPARDKKAQIAEKIVALKKEAAKKKLAIEKIYQETKNTISKGAASQKKEAEKITKKEPEKKSIPPQPEKITPKPAVIVSPLDDEDRKLTAEVLGNVQEEKSQTNDSAKIDEKEIVPSIPETVFPAEKRQEPMDLNRLTEIREIYLKASETLNLK